MSDTVCESTRYATGTCDSGRFEVVYFNTKGIEVDAHPACFRHGLAEVDRHYASAGIARCEMRPRSAA